MKTLIICVSVHHGNTRKIAEAMAGSLDAEVMAPDEVDPGLLGESQFIGFGSGIYRWKHHVSLLNFAAGLPPLRGKAFIFSTRGNLIRVIPLENYHQALRDRLRSSGLEIVGEFSCLGLDTSGPLNLVGGKNKGRPDENDLTLAREFAEGLASGARFDRIMGN